VTEIELNTTFINNKTAATPAFYNPNFCPTIHIGENECFWKKELEVGFVPKIDI